MITQQQSMVSDEVIMEANLNMHKSKQDFINFCEMFGGQDAVEVANWYIQEKGDIDEFCASYFCGNPDDIYNDLCKYACCVEA